MGPIVLAVDESVSFKIYRTFRWFPWNYRRTVVLCRKSIVCLFYNIAHYPAQRDQLLATGCVPAIAQQSVGSHYLAAQNKRGNIKWENLLSIDVEDTNDFLSLVPTTSIYTSVHIRLANGALHDRINTVSQMKSFKMKLYPQHLFCQAPITTLYKTWEFADRFTS